MAVKHRCPFCRKVVRTDGTCQNKDCVMYTPPKDDETEKNDEEQQA